LRRKLYAGVFFLSRAPHRTTVVADSGQCDLALENLALRQQLAILKRTQKRPAISTKDRLFWVWLSRIWSEWRASFFEKLLRYYHRSRTHLSLCKDAPEPRAKQAPECGPVIEIAEVGGLHRRCERRAALGSD